MTATAGGALTPLIGRERELGALESRLEEGARLVTLLGPGGSGKTRLARELFERRRHVGEAYFVDLYGVLDPGLVPSEIADELGAKETPALDAAAVVVETLIGSSATLILDNLEELTDAADFLAGLLESARSIQIVATSRVPLRIPGEVEFQVPPLELPRGDERADLEASPAGALFLQRARAVGRLQEFDGPTAKAIADLCRRLDGLPLALELASARTRILPPASILRRLLDHTRDLIVEPGIRDRRHESLDAVLSWSLDLLGPAEAEVLGAVAICPGGFDLALAEAIAPGLDVLRALDVLARNGLLTQRSEAEATADATEADPWYRLLETIRVAALGRVPAEVTMARRKLFAAHIARRVSGALEAYYKLDERAFREIDELLDDARAVLDWAEDNDTALALAIAAQLSWYWASRGLYREGMPRLRTAIAARPEPSHDLALALTGLATLHIADGSLAEARRAADAAVTAARLIEDAEREVDALELAITLADQTDQAVVDRLRSLIPRVEHPAIRYAGLSALAWARGLRFGFSEDVVGEFRDAEAVLSGTPYRRFQGAAASNLAVLCLYRGRPVDAFDHSTRAMAALASWSPEMLAQVHAVRATAAASTGRRSDAISSLRLAVALSGRDNRRWTEIVIAAVAVLASMGRSTSAAKVWGTLAGSTLTEADRDLGERMVAPARRAMDPVAYTLAYRTGQDIGPATAIGEVLADLALEVDEPDRPLTKRLQHGTLTQRELDVLSLVGAGESDADIAARLFISPKTVSVHLSNAKAKLGIETRLDAALWARDRGLVAGALDRAGDGPHD